MPTEYGSIEAVQRTGSTKTMSDGHHRLCQSIDE